MIATLRQLPARLLRRLLAPRMVYGLASSDGEWRAHSRISTHTHVEAPARLRLGDHVFIGHFNLIDASGELEIGDGCQITNHCSVLTHSTHLALRLERERFWGHPVPAGVQRQTTVLGPWCFVGPHSVIAPGARLGCGVLVKAYSHVRGDVPDFAIVDGRPAGVVGDVRDLDRAWLAEQGPALGAPAHAALARAYESWVAGVASAGAAA